METKQDIQREINRVIAARDAAICKGHKDYEKACQHYLAVLVFSLKQMR
jgi:predicted benzoate:H+ symporter BenE